MPTRSPYLMETTTLWPIRCQRPDRGRRGWHRHGRRRHGQHVVPLAPEDPDLGEQRSHNTLEFNPLIGARRGVGELTLNLLTGLGPTRTAARANKQRRHRRRRQRRRRIHPRQQRRDNIVAALIRKRRDHWGHGNDTLTGSAFGPLNLLVADRELHVEREPVRRNKHLRLWQGVVTITNFMPAQAR